MMAESTRNLVLASGSSYRKNLLRRLGVSFDVDAPDVDESRRDGETPARLAQRLARAKAEAVAERTPDAWVIGSDQVIALGKDVLSKPGTAERARAQLARLQGKEHQLMTAVCVIGPDGRRGESLTTYRMKMRTLDEREIAEYVAEDSPLDCAGSYRIESAGIGLFESLAGDDYTAIVGLPLTRVRAHLEELGYFDEGTT